MNEHKGREERKGKDRTARLDMGDAGKNAAASILGIWELQRNLFSFIFGKRCGKQWQTKISLMQMQPKREREREMAG